MVIFEYLMDLFFYVNTFNNKYWYSFRAFEKYSLLAFNFFTEFIIKIDFAA